MALPFDVSFRQFSNNKPIKIREYVQSENEIYSIKEESIAELTENLDTYLNFSGSTKTKLYLDGLDTLPEDSVEEDEFGNIYLETSETEYTLFEHGESNPYYPLIPGYYRIHVKHKEEHFYSIFRVKPKQVTVEQWKVMRNEIEETLHGLAQDLIRKNSNIVNQNGKSPLPISILREWYIISNHKTKLISSLQELAKKPRHSIYKSYSWVNKPLAKQIDNNTIKSRLEHPEKSDQLNTAIRKLNINLPENKLLKRMVTHIQKVLVEIQEFCFSYIILIQKELNKANQYSYKGSINGQQRSLQIKLDEIKGIKLEVKKLLNICNKFLMENWVQEIDIAQGTNVPPVMTMDHRYQVLHKLYKSLIKSKLSININQFYLYNWKRTDLLYEIWGLVQVINAFSSDEVGFIPKSGWLIEDYPEIPEIKSGDKITMTNNDIKIQIVYEGELLAKGHETSLYNPILISGNNNLPDCRVDYYDFDGYIGSLIFDFKYRPVTKIWNRNKIKSRRQTKTMRQINNYKNSCRSPWYLKNRMDPYILREQRPVREVWGIYPLQNHEKPDRDLDEYGIRLMDLTPNENKQHFINCIKMASQEIIDSGKRHQKTN